MRVTFEEVFAVLHTEHGRPVGNEVYASCPNPFCSSHSKKDHGHGSYKCGCNLSTLRSHCFVCGFGGNPISFYAEATGRGGSKEGYMEALKELTGDETVHQQLANRPHKEWKQEPEIPLLPLAERDRAYRYMLSLLTLSKAHKENLLSRGLTETEIIKIGYKSFTKDDWHRIPNLMLEAGFTLKGLPGFKYEPTLKRWETIGVISGILVPYLSGTNMIQGIQVRADKKPGDKHSKYFWFGTKGKCLGSGPKAYTHFACEMRQDPKSGVFFPVAADKEGTLMITEGGMKADIIHAISGLPVLAIPGVNTQEQLAKVVNSGYLQKLGVKRIEDRFDMDYENNPNVKSAMNDLRTLIAAAGLEYVRHDWAWHVEGHTDLKGYDDYLAYRIRHV